ncbi:hypothetical protein [Haliscomenobacter sp.]|uniref:hypothetical protein n=1 Tax=Haliscomenobacter sp. TaxID=2717303 RepID=UPI003592FA3D
MSKPHRGRMQAQGNGLEKSVSWSQDEPLTRTQAKGLLQRLKGPTQQVGVRRTRRTIRAG